MHPRVWARRILAIFLLWVAGSDPAPALATGVTVVTHGFNGNVTDWVIPMISKMAQYPTFPGTNASLYQISITSSGGSYSTTATFLDGVSPAASASGEILVALDWSSLSGLTGPSTTVIASNAAAALLSTTLIADLGGHALAELPLHLVGHSRGASVMAELARILGAQGIWVDQLTPLDPFPLSLTGDPSMKLYANVLFVDNYWQNIDFPSGQALTGAYNRQLTALGTGGYPVGSAHSDVHLWYHGTVDLNTPTGDNLALITAAERTNWWTAIEAAGTNAGFHYSFIGGADWLSTVEPAGTGTGRIVDGLNKNWDLGAGVAANRTALPGDNAAWPNVIRLVLPGGNQVALGQTLPIAFYAQFGASTSSTATVRFYLDPEANPYHGNPIQLLAVTLAGTGTTNVAYALTNLAANPGLVLPGTYFLYARISNAAHARYAPAPQKIVVTPSLTPPVLYAAAQPPGPFAVTVFGVPGQTIVLQVSSNLLAWTPLLTNTLTNGTWTATDTGSVGFSPRFYRAALAP